MSESYKNQDPISIAKQAERDLNSHGAKHGGATRSDTANESGVDTAATNKFLGSSVTVGSAASGAGDNRDIPASEGGGVNAATGQPLKARDFEGAGGPETKAALKAQEQGGSDDVKSNVRN